MCIHIIYVSLHGPYLGHLWLLRTARESKSYYIYDVYIGICICIYIETCLYMCVHYICIPAWLPSGESSAYTNCT